LYSDHLPVSYNHAQNLLNSYCRSMFWNIWFWSENNYGTIFFNILVYRWCILLSIRLMHCTILSLLRTCTRIYSVLITILCIDIVLEWSIYNDSMFYYNILLKI
jgi:hypothetical protein